MTPQTLPAMPDPVRALVTGARRRWAADRAARVLARAAVIEAAAVIVVLAGAALARGAAPDGADAARALAAGAGTGLLYAAAAIGRAWRRRPGFVAAALRIETRLGGDGALAAQLAGGVPGDWQTLVAARAARWAAAWSPAAAVPPARLTLTAGVAGLVLLAAGGLAPALHPAAPARPSTGSEQTAGAAPVRPSTGLGRTAPAPGAAGPAAPRVRRVQPSERLAPAVVGDPLRITAEASDPDGDLHRGAFVLDEGEPRALLLDDRAVVPLAWTGRFDAPGEHLLVLSVADRGGRAARLDWLIDVRPRAPGTPPPAPPPAAGTGAAPRQPTVAIPPPGVIGPAAGTPPADAPPPAPPPAGPPGRLGVTPRRAEGPALRELEIEAVRARARGGDSAAADLYRDVFERVVSPRYDRARAGPELGALDRRVLARYFDRLRAPPPEPAAAGAERDR